MQDIKREFEHFIKTNRGEFTLSQHLDRLSDVNGNVEEVKNLMKRIQPLEAQNRAMKQMLKDMQKKVDTMENRVDNTENGLKNFSDQSCSILKVIPKNIKNLLNKLEQGRNQGTKDMKYDQGPCKRTREISKKIEVMDDREIHELRASPMNINILADQATDLLKIL